MGTTRAWWCSGIRRFLAASALTGAAVAGLVACDPAGGLNSASIAVTTDRTGTSALQRNGVDVRWLSCSAGVDRQDGGGAVNGSPAASLPRTGHVECTGRTRSGQDISISGKVTQALDGRCVRGDLTARADGRDVFRTDVLGDCDARPTFGAVYPPGNSGQGGVRPAVTVTVTVTGAPWG
ncbi:hypothetical protein ACF1FX_09290 [Streptomyces sp. NPDC014646]|uniref:hypothetical protein n=1 Tax=Streptomyces sp. NPDC014646 TaxID=3364877 RepID=UPI0036FDAF1E